MHEVSVTPNLLEIQMNSTRRRAPFISPLRPSL